MFEILYHPDVRKDLERISSDKKITIRKAIEEKLMKAPQEFGEALRRNWKGYWKLRVGDYRIIYKISSETVTIFRIGHRREIYEK